MSTQQEQITALETEVNALRRDVDLIAQAISRYGVADPRIGNDNFIEILDRLDRLESRKP